MANFIVLKQERFWAVVCEHTVVRRHSSLERAMKSALRLAGKSFDVDGAPATVRIGETSEPVGN